MDRAGTWRKPAAQHAPTEKSGEGVGWRSSDGHGGSAGHWRRPYLSIPTKFSIALVIAILWTGLSVWLSQRWIADLASVTSPTFAIVAIMFIAYVPGFMNAFLISTLLLDRRPPCRTFHSYPGVSILVAAYNEAAAIADTLTSLAAQDYRGDYEVLVLNDGSTD